MRKALLWGLALVLGGETAWADPIPAVQSSSNMEIIGHSDLNGAGHGAGHGGEGLAMRVHPDGRRVLFLAHESGPTRVSIVHVTKPENPKMITQIPVSSPQIRYNTTHSIQINDVYVDENGPIYANARLSGGLDIIHYTGSVPPT